MAEADSGPPGPAEGLASDEELLRRYNRRREPTVREELVRRYMPFARSMALRYRGGSEPTEDLIQVASLGLVNAINRFDPERGIPFVAFAAPTGLEPPPPARAPGAGEQGRGGDHQAHE
jgi:RNA polymerase sigma-B factor